MVLLTSECSDTQVGSSLKLKYAVMEQTECIRKGNIYKQRRPRCAVSSGSALFAKINTLLVNSYMIRPSLIGYISSRVPMRR